MDKTTELQFLGTVGWLFCQDFGVLIQRSSVESFALLTTETNDKNNI